MNYARGVHLGGLQTSAIAAWLQEIFSISFLKKQIVMYIVCRSNAGTRDPILQIIIKNSILSAIV
jgi:hypothetical protein